MNRKAKNSAKDSTNGLVPPQRFRPYTDYRDSGVSWLGKIPGKWNQKRLKFCAWLVNQKIEAITSDLPYIGMENIESHTSQLIGMDTETTADGLSNVFKSGDILFGKLRPYLAKALYTTMDGLCSSELLVYRPREGVPRFILYYILSGGFVETVNASTYGAKMPRASSTFIGNLPLLLPSLKEQQAIAKFLDRETARIDELIDKKQQLIKLLAEKRSALISHAVTKGLNPDAQMKDSGIEWLGKVPSHWTFEKLGHIATMQGGGTPHKDRMEYWNGTIPWVSPKDMKRRVIDDSTDHVTPKAIRETTIRLISPPAVLIVVRGMILSHTFPVGLTAVPVTINQDMKAISTTPQTSADYLAYLLQGIAPAFLAIVEESGHGTKCLRTDLWKGFGLFIAPPNEQIEICEYVKNKTTKLNKLIVEVETAVKRLIEYRSALISAAVTGQIDVREEVTE